MRGIFGVSESVKCQVWNPTSVLKEPEQTLQNCDDGQVHILCSSVADKIIIGKPFYR